MHRVAIMALAMILLAVCGQASATIVLTFDELTTPSTKGAFIPNGYGGFNWLNFQYHLNNYGGYKNGCVSLPHVAFNLGGGPAVVANGLFDFVGAYLTGAWRTDLNIDVEGYHDGILVYSQTVVAEYSEPTWFEFNFTNVDKLIFNSYGGTEVPELPGSGTHFAMDNFTFVPEPCTLLLLGLGGLALLRKRRQL